MENIYLDDFVLLFASSCFGLRLLDLVILEFLSECIASSAEVKVPQEMHLCLRIHLLNDLVKNWPILLFLVHIILKNVVISLCKIACHT